MSWQLLDFTPPRESYDGFKFSVARTLCLIFGLLSVVFIIEHCLRYTNFSEALTPLPDSWTILYHYVAGYYFKTGTGALELLVILAAFAATFWLNIPKQYFVTQYRDYGKHEATPEAKSLTAFLTICALGCTIFAVPLLSLHFPTAISYLVKLGAPVLGILRYLALLPIEADRVRIPATANLAWDRRNFDSAYRAPKTRDAEREITDCRAHLEACQDAAAAVDFLRHGSPKVTWSGIDVLFENLERCLQIPPAYLSLHDRASDAVAFAISEACESRQGQGTVLLTTDAGHPAQLRRLKNELQPFHGFRLEAAPVQARLWASVPQQEISSAVAKACIEKHADIVLASHVFPGFGSVLDLKQVVEEVRRSGANPVFIIDGSQAIGNIAVGDDVFTRVPYYVFTSHSCLLAPPSLGVMIRNEWLLAQAHKITAAPKFQNAFAVYRSNGEEVHVPSFEKFEPYFGLNYVLKHEWLALGMDKITTHNAALAALFRRELAQQEVRIIGGSNSGAIALVTADEHIPTLHACFEERNLRAKMVSWPTGEGLDLQGLRFCFHNYHNDEDVRRLADTIGQLVTQVNRRPRANAAHG
jgi:selenocysteine lyase/cysteine desulfurase